MVDKVLCELAASGEPFVLVIDDLHELSSAEATEQLTTLLTSLPPRVHAILATRRDPQVADLRRDHTARPGRGHAAPADPPTPSATCRPPVTGPRRPVCSRTTPSSSPSTARREPWRLSMGAARCHYALVDSMYDRFAEQYELHSQVGVRNAAYDRPALLDLVGNVSGLAVLDVGCGPGFYAQELIRRGAAVTAFDVSAEMVRLAGARLGVGVDLRVADLHDPLTWLADESQDVAVLALVLHHLEDRRGALAELRRVLRPAGRLVLSTSHPTRDWRFAGGSYFDVEEVEETWSPDMTVRYWRQPLEKWCAEFADAGFLIERLIEPRPIPALVETQPDEYRKLTREPGLIAFRLLKSR
jgi:ubiquinone/menaquinone biosynthesis C-methylase UbiE